MDREDELIKSMSELVKIVSGLQDSIKNLNDSMVILKIRIENLKGGKNGKE